jgi:hypothetical protein
MPGVQLNEALMLPLGVSNGIAFYVDGSKVCNIDRSDFQLGWCVKTAKPTKEKEKEATGDEPASSDAMVESQPVKPKGKSAKKAKTTAQKVPKEEPPMTHVMKWSPCEFSWTSGQGRVFNFEIQKPSLCPNAEVDEALRTGVDLRRPAYVWDADMLDRLRCS